MNEQMTTSELNNQLAQLRADDKAFFEEAFKGMSVPPNLRRLSERLCRSYGIRGICDPAYIANVIALELGLGDGFGGFTKKGSQ